MGVCGVEVGHTDRAVGLIDFFGLKLFRKNGFLHIHSPPPPMDDWCVKVLAKDQGLLGLFFFTIPCALLESVVWDRSCIS